MIKYYWSIAFLMFITLTSAFSQDSALKNYDYVYVDYIKSVEFRILTNYSLPVYTLGSYNPLRLSFDDMNEDVSDYIYTITHCNQDWEPSDLDELEYIDGFNGEDLDQYDFSFNTLVEYTHYDLLLPNQDIDFLVSGNYILHVFRDDDQIEPIITRRFLVAENGLMAVGADMVAPSGVNKYYTHQELEFTVNHKGIQIDNPRREITAYVMQNGRWDTMTEGLKPLYIKKDELIFDAQQKLCYPAGREFRFLDIRNFDYRNEGIADIDRTDQYWDIVAKQQKSRAFDDYQSYEDINGNFYIFNADQSGDSGIRSDYAKVLISLKSSQNFEDKDVYVIGAMTDWQLKESFKMVYNPAVFGYVCQPLLKQGVYNYYFATVAKGSTDFTFDDLEGNWHLTENDYNILVYYRPFGERYDRLVSVSVINSWTQ